MLRGTIRDHVTQERRPFLRFFACEEDLSHESPDAPLPDEVASGAEPFLIIGAIAGRMSLDRWSDPEKDSQTVCRNFLISPGTSSLCVDLGAAATGAKTRTSSISSHPRSASL